MLELGDFLNKLEARMDKEKGRIIGSWGRVKAATKIKETERLVAQLERTKSTLTMAVMAYNVSISLPRIGRIRLMCKFKATVAGYSNEAGSKVELRVLGGSHRVCCR